MKFNRSWRWRVPLRSDRKHLWKHHAVPGSMLYELLGIVDLWASNDPTFRFVSGSIGAITEFCNKGKRDNGVVFTERWIKFGLAELQARHIVSPYFTTWDGRYGFIMAPHHSMCHRIGKVCVLHAPKAYECTPADVPIFEQMGMANPGEISSPTVHRRFTGSSPISSPTVHRQFTGRFTGQFTDQFTAHDAQDADFEQDENAQ